MGLTTDWRKQESMNLNADQYIPDLKKRLYVNLMNRA